MIPGTWVTMAERCPPSPQEAETGQRLLDEALARGYLPHTCLEMLRLPDGAILHFYRLLAEQRPVESPFRCRPDSGWMADADFCFINIRATGLEQAPGTPIQAAKLLPALRANAIHLGPFTTYDFHVIYAVRSIETIAPIIVDPRLAAAGFSAEDQMQALVDAAHLLGKAVGFDLEPHTSQFSTAGLMRPSLFRWLKLAGDGEEMADGLTEEEMLSKEQQARLAVEVQAIVAQELQARHLATLEGAPGDDPPTTAAKGQAFEGLVGELIRLGYWPVPVQVWSGVGLPAFDGYDHEANHPRFRYLSRDGQDHSAYAYHILAPFKFYDGLRPNQLPEPAHLPELGEQVVSFFCDIFPHWRDRLGLDFVRYDSADHIFDSLWQDDPAVPASDRPTPYVLQRCIEASRTPGHAYVGNLAERMGNEVAEYAGLGYDLMLGTDMLERVDQALMDKSFQLYDRLVDLNRDRPSRFAVTFGVDTHDTGSPHIWGEPLVKVMGPERMRLRHFVSRFVSAGLGRRPKYEVMGSQDLSYGLYLSNVGDVNLTWVGDATYNRGYHWLEDLYETFRPFLATAEIGRRVVTERYAWWLIRPACRRPEDGWLIPVVALEVEGGEPEAVTVEIDRQEVLPGQGPWQVVEHDAGAMTSRTWSLPGPSLRLTLAHLGCRLLHVHSGAYWL
jgi:hypothetical protein